MRFKTLEEIEQFAKDYSLFGLLDCMIDELSENPFGRTLDVLDAYQLCDYKVFIERWELFLNRDKLIKFYGLYYLWNRKDLI